MSGRRKEEAGLSGKYRKQRRNPMGDAAAALQKLLHPSRCPLLQPFSVARCAGAIPDSAKHHITQLHLPAPLSPSTHHSLPLLQPPSLLSPLSASLSLVAAIRRSRPRRSSRTVHRDFTFVCFARSRYRNVHLPTLGPDGKLHPRSIARPACTAQTKNKTRPPNHQIDFKPIHTSLHSCPLVRRSAQCSPRYWQQLGCSLAWPSTPSMPSPPFQLWEQSSSTAMEHSTTSRACKFPLLCTTIADCRTGIAYQLTEADPLIDATQCKLDATSMAALGANAIRVYHVDPTADHTGCMSAFADVGIYLFVDLETFNTAIDPVSRCERFQGPS